MSKIEKGVEVVMKSPQRVNTSTNKPGTVCVVLEKYSDSYQSNGYSGIVWKLKSVKDSQELYAFEDDLKINNNNMTNLIERAKLAFKTEPAKTLIKAGFFTNEELPTKEGADIYLAYLMKNDSKFKTDILDPLVEEQKKDNE